MSQLRRIIKQSNWLYVLAKIIYKPYAHYLDDRDQRLYLEWQKRNQKIGSDKPVQEGPLISVVVPLYNTPKKYFWEMINSVLNQTYKNWELILVDDASPDSEVRNCIDLAGEKDERIKKLFLNSNHHIADATNQGIKIATGEYISLLDHDDILHTEALNEVAAAIVDSRPDLVYTDESKIDESGEVYSPFFKPAWNFNLLRSVNYITHLTTFRRGLVDAIGGEDGSYNGTQDWEFLLRLTRSVERHKILHIPKQLYYWRVHKNSTAYQIEAKPYVIDAQRKALERDLVERRTHGIVRRDVNYGAQWQVVYPQSIEGVLITVVLCGDLKKDMTDVQHDLVEYIKPNQTHKARGEYILYANSPFKLSTPDLEMLVGEASQNSTGFVAPFIKDEEMIWRNLNTILDPGVVSLIMRLSRRSLSRHIYTTTKYSIGALDAPIALIDATKMSGAGVDLSGSVKDMSSSLAGAGYDNVYIPFVEC